MLLENKNTKASKGKKNLLGGIIEYISENSISCCTPNSL